MKKLTFLFVYMYCLAAFCSTKDYSNTNKIKIKEPLLAKINIVGVDQLPLTKTDNLHAWIEYSDENEIYFKKRVILNAQGASSLQYPKKNLSMDFCEDEWIGDSTTSVQIGNWVKQDAFHFKANWIDTFRGGLAVATAYKFYDDISRDDLPIYERAGLTDYDEKALCHSDGFPCIISLNGVFQGVYAWQLKKHRKNANMQKDNPKHVWFQLETYTKSLDNGEMNWDHIEIKNPKTVTDESKGYIEALARYNNELTALEKTSSKEEMREEIAKRYDITSVINMILHAIMTSNIDGLGKNANFFTYDGQKWFVMPYDLDETFGNSWIATFQFPAAWSFITSDYTFKDIREKQPFYWISKYFWQDIKDKYKYLRDNGTITTDNIIRHLSDWNERVGKEHYDAEYAKWTECPSSTTPVVSDKWQFIPDWTQYYSDDIPDYDDSHEYNPGDTCRYDYRLWRATKSVSNETPVTKKGYFDNEERVKEWLNERIALEDIFLNYLPASGIENTSYNSHSEKTCKLISSDRKIYIRKNNRIYNLSGQEIR